MWVSCSGHIFFYCVVISQKKGKKKIAVHMLYKDNGCAVILAKWTSEIIAQGES